MFPTDTSTWIFYILLAIVLGAIGSGTWEHILKPVIQKTSRILLSILTLGLQSTRNNLYKEIATRPQKKPELLIIMLVIYLTSAGLGVASSEFVRAHIAEDTYNTESLLDLDRKNIEQLEQELKTIKHEANESIKKLAEINKITSKMLLATALFFLTYITTTYAKCAYIHGATCYFDQLMSICHPYISDLEYKEINSKFSQSKSKEDYTAIIGKLQAYANQNGIIPPNFLIF